MVSELVIKARTIETIEMPASEVQNSSFMDVHINSCYLGTVIDKKIILKMITGWNHIDLGPNCFGLESELQGGTHPRQWEFLHCL